MAAPSYENRRFRPVASSDRGEAGADTVFHYRQAGNIVTADYSGGAIARGHLIALVDEAGRLEMRYHHVNTRGELQTGVCRSIPERLPDGRLRLHETWQWTSGDRSSGTSILEEIDVA